jgi:hypothetical protein
MSQVVSAAASAFFNRVVPINIPYYNYSVDRHASILEGFMTMSTYSQVLNKHMSLPSKLNPTATTFLPDSTVPRCSPPLHPFTLLLSRHLQA